MYISVTVNTACTLQKEEIVLLIALCSGLRQFISKDVMCLLNQTALSLPSKSLLKMYCSLWLAALSRCECMCLNLPVKLCEDTSYLMSPYHTKMLIVGRCAFLSYTVLYRKAGG